MSDGHSRERCDAGRIGFTQLTIEEFSKFLQAQGYASSTIEQYVSAAKQFHFWLEAEERELAVTESSVTAFVSSRGNKPSQRNYVRSSLRHLVRMLHERGDLSPRTLPVNTAIEKAVQDFVSYLSKSGGLAASTCRQRADYTRRFLKAVFSDGLLQLERICPQDLEQFVRGETAEWSPSSIRALTSSLRSYLRFLQFLGICDHRLIAAVPQGPAPKPKNLPRVMTEDQLCKFLSSFNRNTTIGRRDYAIAQLLATLGMRVGEVAMLQLDHFNWQDSSLRISRPKSRRENVLPMPASVGEAVSDYLARGRPTTSHRFVFVKHVGPADPLLQPAMRACVRRAFKQCDFDPTWQGTHILRHTVATRLHQRGATLKELSDLLGHRSVEMTKVYTKLNLPVLSAVALPWPEVIQ